MAKLYLRSEQTMIKECELRDGTAITIGRLPDNDVHIDDPAVSGHHARIVWEGDHFALEDNNSLNGTFVNKRRINRCALQHGDVILMGKHNLTYWDEARQAAAMPKLEATMVLDTRQAQEMLDQQQGAGGDSAAARERIGRLTVMDGKTDQEQYVLSGKLTVIGKSEMASIKLKGWFAPKVAAVINNREGKYVIAPSEKNVKVKVNNTEITGQKELDEGDMIELAHVKLTFSYAE